MAELLRQFFRFSGVGCVSAVAHYGLLILLVQVAGVDAVIASAAGALLGAVVNYALNYRFTFRSNKAHHESVRKFVVVALVGLGLNTLLMWVLVDGLRAHYLLAQVLTTGLVLIWSFSGNRFWTFHERPASSEGSQ
ncbi:MAG: GtrA-like protein [Betaproteobacteria bacterium ADurb.Bin341]|nr:MAG: GtrA-like protein [Betaproteobacteria bacterium ADurb.Bin341]